MWQLVFIVLGDILHQLSRQISEKSLGKLLVCVCVCVSVEGTRKEGRWLPFTSVLPQMLTFWQNGNTLDQAGCIWLPLIIFLFLMNFLLREHKSCVRHWTFFSTIGPGTLIPYNKYSNPFFYFGHQQWLLITFWILQERIMNFLSIVGYLSEWLI